MKKKFLFSMLVASSLLIPSSIMANDCSYMKYITDLSELSSEDVPCISETVSKRVNSKLPSQIDANTFLEGSDYNDDVLIYKYKIVGFDKNFDWDKLETTLSDKLKKKNCSNKGLKDVLDLGLKILHIYNDDKLFHTIKIKVDSNTCKNIK